MLVDGSAIEAAHIVKGEWFFIKQSVRKAEVKKTANKQCDTAPQNKPPDPKGKGGLFVVCV